MLLFHREFSKFGFLNAPLVFFTVVLLLQSVFLFSRPKYDEIDYNNFISKATTKELGDEIRENPQVKKARIPPLDENLLLCGIRNDISPENIEILLSRQSVHYRNIYKQDALIYLALYADNNEEIIPLILSSFNKASLKRALKRKDGYKKNTLDYIIENRNIPLYNELFSLLGKRPLKKCTEALFGTSANAENKVEATGNHGDLKGDSAETSEENEENMEEPEANGVLVAEENASGQETSEIPPLSFESMDISSEKSRYIYLYDYIPEQEKFIPERTSPSQIALAKIDNPNSRDSNGRTMLMNAAKNGSEWEVRSLLRSGADISLSDYEGWNALMYAIRYQNNLEIVHLLLENGADIYASNKYGTNALLLAASYSNDPEILKAVLNQYTAGSNEIFKAFILTLTSNNTSAAVQEAKLKVFIDKNVPLNRFFEGKTPLMYAAEFSGTTSILKLLLDAGAISTMRDANGRTAFDYASQNARLSHDDIFWSLNSN